MCCKKELMSIFVYNFISFNFMFKEKSSFLFYGRKLNQMKNLN